MKPGRRASTYCGAYLLALFESHYGIFADIAAFLLSATIAFDFSKNAATIENKNELTAIERYTLLIFSCLNTSNPDDAVG